MADLHERDVALAGGLAAAVDGLSTRPTVLVATDFDGVLAPLVDDPHAARPQPGTVETLLELATRPGTHVAVVSGRDLATLTRVSTLEGSAVTRIGSHGAESSRARDGSLLGDRQRDLLDAVTGELEEVVRDHPGVRLEHKPAAVALHSRGADRDVVASATAGARRVASRHAEVSVLEGKDVVELSVIRADKGSALAALADELGADAVVYLGDDVTDEHAFEVLGERDVTVKVGDGATAARYRLHTPEEVPAVLEAVLRARTSSP